MNKIVPFKEKDVKEYLDNAINHWRMIRDLDSGTDEHEAAVYYIDAFQSVRASLFGELLSIE
jgi:hypothetical protein